MCVRVRLWALRDDIDQVEAMGIANTDSVESALPVLAAALSGSDRSCVVVTTAAEGAVAMRGCRGRQSHVGGGGGGEDNRVQVEAPVLDKVVDPTGSSRLVVPLTHYNEIYYYTELFELASLLRLLCDTTGAGDAFNSGFLACYTRGGSLTDSMRCGTLTGSICITKVLCSACTIEPTLLNICACITLGVFDLFFYII